MRRENQDKLSKTAASGLVALVFLGIVVLSYIILAALYGWKYVVLFEMDETGITHIQLPKQVKIPAMRSAISPPADIRCYP